MVRDSIVGWLLEKVWRWDLVAAGSTLLYGSGVGAMYADDYTIARTFYFVAIVWLTAKVVVWEETRAHKKRFGISIVVLLLAVAGLFLSDLWIRHRAQSMRAEKPSSVAHRSPPSPPMGLKVGMGFDIPLFVQEGTLRLPKSVTPCSGGKRVGHFGPRHSSSKRPQLALYPLTYRFVEWNDFIDFSFEMEITNSGEQSIIKDWELCLVQPDKSVVRFHATKLSPEDNLKQPLGHGRSITGWIAFHAPRDAGDTTDPQSLSQITGGLQCRDYLDNASRVVFFTEPKKP
jgi:hypothetical protein